MIETNHSISPLSPQFRASISMAVRVLAQRSAVEIVKHQLRARGLKVYSFAHQEIVALAHDYIAAHAELIAEATVTVEERRRLRPEAIAQLLRISVGKAQRIAVKMALKRMNTELARSRVQLGDPA